MPGRSMVSAKTALGSSPDTKVFAQTVSATVLVATRIARSGRKMAPSVTTIAGTNAAAIHLCQATYLSPRPDPQRGSRAFSSEVETGSRQENASNQESGAPFRFYRNGKGSSRQAPNPSAPVRILQ